MRKAAGTFRSADLRVSLLLILVNAVAVMLCVHELSFMALLFFGLLWLGLRGRSAAAVKAAALYLILLGLSRWTLGVKGLETIWIFSHLLRHLLIPMIYADGLPDAATGTILAAFRRMRFPKAFGISTVVLLRFFPTIRYEFQAIRNSLKYRGIGIGIRDTLAHIPSNFELILVPLLIRISRISEELSAAAMVRGVRLNNEIISFEEVCLRRRDILIAVLFGVPAVLICTADRMRLWEGFL